MRESVHAPMGQPVGPSERFLILDALRGFALLGICLANFPEFSFYTFLLPEAREALPTSGIDRFVMGLIYTFIDGKFYTIFSLLFGIGFSIIINNALKRGISGFKIFYRRMAVLMIIGFAHLMLLWSGDILMLYALVGMILPIFHKCNNKTLLLWSLFFLLLPVGVDFLCQATQLNLAHPLVEQQWILCNKYGITEENFAYYLKDADSYGDVFKFLIMGSVERMSEFVDGNRYFKVLGLFLLGFYIGRNRLYSMLWEKRKVLRNIALIGILIGLPLSTVYSWSCLNSHPLGLGLHSLLYFISVYITSFGYISLFCLLYLWASGGIIWRLFSYPGRMALTNYIGQSVFGIIIFYGIGFGIGATTGLVWVEWIAFGVFVCEVILSQLWLRRFRFGPLEWIWRCLTYGKIFRILNDKDS